VLRRCVPAAALVGDSSRGRADVEDHARTTRDKCGHQGLGDRDQPDDVDLVHPSPVVEIRLRDRREPERGTGVVDEYVETGADPRRQGLDVVRGGDVAADRRTCDLGGQVLDPVLSTGGAEHVVALGGEASGGGGADSAARTGHDRSPGSHGPILHGRRTRNTCGPQQVGDLEVCPP
jgi:hypothetical protein